MAKKAKNKVTIPKVFAEDVRELLLDALRERGYSGFKTKVIIGGVRRETITAMHEDGVTRFVAEAEANIPTETVIGRHGYSQSTGSKWTTYKLIVKKRTKGSGYVELYRHKHMTKPEEVTEFFAIYDDIVGSIQQTGYPRPWEFVPDVVMHRAEKHTSFSTRSQIKSVMALSLVTINKGYTTIDITGSRITEPGTRCWFLLDCTGHKNANFNIISDGEVFYPVSRLAAWQGTGGQQYIKIKRDVGRVSVDATEISKADQRLIKMAIEDWVERFNG